jgi:hypothetical protein
MRAGLEMKMKTETKMNTHHAKTVSGSLTRAGDGI